MYGLFKQLQTYNAVCGQQYDGFCIWSREIHGGFLDSLTELPVANALSKSCSGMFHTVPSAQPPFGLNARRTSVRETR